MVNIYTTITHVKSHTHVYTHHKRTNNDLQNIIQKIKDRAKRVPL